ncbi:TlpA disulfide reductase family protein [Thalassotalea agarivorans]|uniref:Thiol-disulfide isomerase or thioredoxin n=1 Tax=Thalassotalea agarivorans TaxID=349064 RepID=A0A1I0CCA7_THASX|nr:TlpA disulfide reductase family protein [Thalassotalea agarivorans]SET17187.1 Thiol-disulfide isomerase or thioredoxin [Thalassotalea agarivorans]
MMTTIIRLFIPFAIGALLITAVLIPKTPSTPKQQLTQLLEQHQGKVVFVDFWASWCLPCREAMPWLNEMQSQHTEKNFQVISINLDAEKQYADEFLNEFPASFPVIFDSEGETAQAYQLKGMPSSYIYDKTGKLVAVHQGFNQDKKQQFEQEIKTLIEQ